LDTPAPKEEFLAGSREVAPLLLGTVPFGFVVGVATVAAGMTPLEGLALSVFSFSGIAQLIAAQLIAVGSPVIVTVGAGAVLGLRLLMYSAALAPHVAHLPLRWRLAIAYMLTDQGFALAVRHYEAPGDRTHRHWHLIGSSAVLWITWQASIVAGLFAGAAVPASWSLDFTVVLTFIALLMPALRSRVDVAVALVAGAVALVGAGLPYRLALVVASVAGIAVGLAIELRREAAR
jgi:predicted branched-subunit amino acid permease